MIFRCGYCQQSRRPKRFVASLRTLFVSRASQTVLRMPPTLRQQQRLSCSCLQQRRMEQRLRLGCLTWDDSATYAQVGSRCRLWGCKRRLKFESQTCPFVSTSTLAQADQSGPETILQTSTMFRIQASFVLVQHCSISGAVGPHPPRPTRLSTRNDFWVHRLNALTQPGSWRVFEVSVKSSSRTVRSTPGLFKVPAGCCAGAILRPTSLATLAWPSCTLWDEALHKSTWSEEEIEGLQQEPAEIF